MLTISFFPTSGSIHWWLDSLPGSLCCASGADAQCTCLWGASTIQWISSWRPGHAYAWAVSHQGRTGGARQEQCNGTPAQHAGLQQQCGVYGGGRDGSHISNQLQHCWLFPPSRIQYLTLGRIFSLSWTIGALWSPLHPQPCCVPPSFPELEWRHLSSRLTGIMEERQLSLHHNCNTYQHLSS